jgi:hypothetical protein|tara:strand:- start:828 stop:2495 length:1668 start_codon:yes stop_codon:yes gene_type:complete
MSFDTFDPYGYIYLNPGLEHLISDSVELAYTHFSNSSEPRLKHDLVNEIPSNFDYVIYYNLNVQSILNTFDTPEYSSCNYFDINDIERLAKIHYAYSSEPNKVFTISPDFNPELYRVFHNVPDELSSSELYYDYLNKKNSQEFAVGNIEELGYHLRHNVSLEFNDLIVRGESVHRGNLYVDSNVYVAGIVELSNNELIINGGSLQINADYANVNSIIANNRIIQDDFITSNIEIINDVIIGNQLTVDSIVTNTLNTSTIDTTSLIINNIDWNGHASNLYGLDQLALSTMSNDLILSPDFSSIDTINISNLYVSNTIELNNIHINQTSLQPSVSNISLGNDMHYFETTFTSNIMLGSIQLSQSNSTVTVDGSVQADSFPQTSDKKFKSNIKPVDVSHSVNGLENVNIYEYNYLNDYIPKIGVIAQEIQAIFPNLVRTQERFIKQHSQTIATITEKLTEFFINIGINQVPNLNEYCCIILVPITEDLEANISEISVEIIKSYDNTTTIYSQQLKQFQDSRFFIKGFVTQYLSVDYTQLFCHLLIAYKDLKNKVSAIM